MPRQAGYFEWDDADLTPGQKREGGWHQNLYDEDGRLQGHARFVPTDDRPNLDEDVPSTSYIPTDQRSAADDSFELAIAATVAAVYLAAKGTAYAAPHVKHWWSQSAQPFVMAQAEKLASRFRRHTEASDDTPEPAHDLAHSNLALPAPGHRQAMSSAEAQARLLAAMAAHTYSQEQLRLVEQAHIVDADGLDDIRQHLTSLPQQQLTAILEHMVRNPALLHDANLANLASLLGREELGTTA